MIEKLPRPEDENLVDLFRGFEISELPPENIETIYSLDETISITFKNDDLTYNTFFTISWVTLRESMWNIRTIF